MSLGQDGPPTRTRLPEGHSGHGGGNRRPQPRRALVTVVSIIVLLVAAIAFANRGGHKSPADGDGSPAAPGTGTSRTGTSSSASATAPTGDSPVTGKTAGIPSGFPHTAQGAQSAAANYAVALGGEGMFETGTRHRIVDTVYSAGSAAASQSQLDKVYSDPAFLQRIGLRTDGAAPKGLTFVSRTNPVGTRLVSYSGGTASVSVWYSSLFGLAGEGSTNPVTESWFTNTFQMTWAGDWKIASFQQKDGPTPVGRDQAASSADEMADAVRGFGGFTYAR